MLSRFSRVKTFFTRVGGLFLDFCLSWRRGFIESRNFWLWKCDISLVFKGKDALCDAILCKGIR